MANPHNPVSAPPYPEQGGFAAPYPPQAPPAYAAQYPPQQPGYAAPGPYPPQQPGFAPPGPGPYPQQQFGYVGPYPAQPAFAGAAPYPRQPDPFSQGQQQQYAQAPYQSGHAADNFVGGDDEENGTADWKGFTDKAIRQAFVRKVYIILMLQLSFTVGVVALFLFEENVKKFVQRNIAISIASYVIFIVVYIILACCTSVRRKFPANVILLAVFTVALSYLVGTISSMYDTNIVIMSLGICACCCLAISVFACQTKYDFTSCGGVLFILVVVLFMFGILTIFTHNRILHTVYSALGALVFMAFLAYDTQMLMGGRKFQLSPEEYIFASLQLYMDIVQIFLYLLAFTGAVSDK